MDIFNYMVRNRLQLEIDQERHQGAVADQKAFELEARIRVLEKSTGALWSLLKAKTGWTDEELIEQAKKTDADLASNVCPSCGRKLLVKNGVSCSWCGQRLDHVPEAVASENIESQSETP